MGFGLYGPIRAFTRGKNQVDLYVKLNNVPSRRFCTTNTVLGLQEERVFFFCVFLKSFWVTLIIDAVVSRKKTKIPLFICSDFLTHNKKIGRVTHPRVHTHYTKPSKKKKKKKKEHRVTDHLCMSVDRIFLKTF